LLLPYARQTIEADDIAAVSEVLTSDWILPTMPSGVSTAMPGWMPAREPLSRNTTRELGLAPAPMTAATRVWEGSRCW